MNKRQRDILVGRRPARREHSRGRATGNLHVVWISEQVLKDLHEDYKRFMSEIFIGLSLPAHLLR